MASDRPSPRQLLPCPSVDLVLLEDGTLQFVPVRGGLGPSVESPWGEAVHAVVVLGRAADDCVAAADQPLLEGRLRALAAGGWLIPEHRLRAHDLDRFERQVAWFAQEGADGPRAHRRLATSNVLIVGMGGIGSAVAELLARGGVGMLGLVDAGRVRERDVPCQLLYESCDVGVRRAFAAANHLERLSPSVRAVPVDLDVVSARQADRLLRRFRPDLVVCAREDVVGTRADAVDAAAFDAGIAVLHAAGQPPWAIAGPLLVPGRTSCHRCFVSHAGGSRPGDAGPSASTEGAAASARPATVWTCSLTGALAAATAVAWLTGIHEPPLVERAWELDQRSFTERWIVTPPSTQRRACSRCRVRVGADATPPRRP